MIRLLVFKKEDYDFFYHMLNNAKQEELSSKAVNQEDRVVVDNEDIEIDLYDWLNDLVVERGFDKIMR